MRRATESRSAGGGKGSPGLGPGLPLPHEQDQSAPSTAPQPQPVIEQAARDLAHGQVDTDLRTTPGLDAARRERLLRPDAADSPDTRGPRRTPETPIS